MNYVVAGLIAIIASGCGLRIEKPKTSPETPEVGEHDARGVAGPTSSNDVAHDKNSKKHEKDDKKTAKKTDPAPAPTPAPAPEPIKETDYKDLFASLDGFRLEFPCGTLVIEGYLELCHSPNPPEAVKIAQGAPEDLYHVTLQIRGVVESAMYKGGTVTNEFFYTGGEVDNGVEGGYNIISMEVSSPKQIYFLNYAPRLSHNIYALDYKVTIPIQGGASIRLVGDGQNGIGVANWQGVRSPAGVEPSDKPFDGQFVQLNVVNAYLDHGAKSP